MTGRGARAGFVLSSSITLFVLFFWCGSATAHQVNLSTARITVGTDRAVDVDIAMKGSDVDRVAGTNVYDAQTGLVRPDALAAVSAKVAGYVAARSAVLAGEDAKLCRSDPSTVLPDADGPADAVEEITGKKVPFVMGPRRDGDPPLLVADSTRLQRELGWKPDYSDLHRIVETAWAWANR